MERSVFATTIDVKNSWTVEAKETKIAVFVRVVMVDRVVSGVVLKLEKACRLG